MLPSLQSISEISRIIETGGSRPIVVLGNDLEDYVCKYDYKNKLIQEFIAHHWLSCWGLPFIPAALMTVKIEHIPTKILGGLIQITNFQKPLFALKYNNEAMAVDNTLLGLKGDTYEIAKFVNRFDLLKIAFFDLWVANTDRNHGNYNLLIVGNNFVPIDHSDIFDGGRLGHELAQLTDEDSILTSDVALTFLNNKTRVQDEASKLIENFPIFVKDCGLAIPNIINDIPDEWCSNKQILLDNVMSALIMNEDWLAKTSFSFSQLIHNFIR